jgi:5-methylcytosine-specific restriction endonuclease McrA
MTQNQNKASATTKPTKTCKTGLHQYSGGYCIKCWKESLKLLRAMSPEEREADIQLHKEEAAKLRLENIEKAKASHKPNRVESINSVRWPMGRLSKNIIETLQSSQRGLCPCCAQPLGDDFHVDHIIPLSMNGTNTDDNVQLLRSLCNKRKKNKHPIDYMQEQGFLL